MKKRNNNNAKMNFDDGEPVIDNYNEWSSQKMSGQTKYVMKDDINYMKSEKI